jgi:hypothetical protein
MGIDITGISNVSIKSVPEQYRSKVIYNSSRNQDPQTAFYRKLMLENINTSDFDVEISNESYEWESCEYENSDLMYVNWATNTAYYKTENSKELDIGRSYSGCADFCQSVNSFTNDHIYFPCEGILDASICLKFYGILLKVWPKWNKIYADKYKLPDNIDLIIIEQINDIDWEIEFYVRLTRILKCGTESGIAKCS